MTAERIATFLGEIENIAALLQRTWTGGSVSDPVADVLANAANLIRTLSARAEAAEARAEGAREALSEIATGAFVGASDAAVAGPAAFAAKLQALAEDALRALLTAPPPTAGMSPEAMEKVGLKFEMPTTPGFYWAKWRIANDGTKEGDELTPSKKWEVVDVFENCTDRSDCEHLMVHVPGVERSQSLDGFVWGDGPLKPPVPRRWLNGER